MTTVDTTSAFPTLFVGDVRITALLDVDVPFPMPIGDVFPSAREDWVLRESRHPEAFAPDGGWRYMVTCYLVETPDRRVLVDTGCGPASLAFPNFIAASGDLPQRLGQLDVAEHEIDTVVITHIHPDHVGGMRTPDGGRAFSQARYLVPAADWESWRRPETQESFPLAFVGDTIAPLVAGGVVDLVDGEQALSDELVLFPTPGHTPGSSCLRVDSGGKGAILVGDLWLHPAQVSEPELGCAFDMDPELARATRSSMADRLAEEGPAVGACHFPEAFGEIVRLEGRNHWVPISRWPR